jgi:hypothetical protein
MQELYAKQSPQVLKTLLEMARIESAESSDRIENFAAITAQNPGFRPQAAF